MKKIPASRSNLLLMEMIISVLLFSFASAVCLQIFVKASLLSKDTAELMPLCGMPVLLQKY